MKRLHKVVSLLLTLSLMLSLMSNAAFAAGKTSDSQIVKQGGKVYYLSDPADGEVAGAENFDVWTSKTIAGTENEDEFEVTLQVGTTIKPVPNDVAVVLVMDVSGSMTKGKDNEVWYHEEDKPEGAVARIDFTRDAALEFVEKYVQNAGSAQRMLSVVQFGNTAQTVLPWTDVNDDGAVKGTAKEAIESVEINFLIEENKDYWNEEQALADFGKTNYWDASEVSAEMEDEFEDYFRSYCLAAAMTDYSDSFYQTEQQEVEGVMTDVSVCTFAGCTNETEGHTHCSYGNCILEEPHEHCDKNGCAILSAHFHCSKCEDVTEHKHCSYEACTITEADHKHCGHEECIVVEAHTHCVRCGLTTGDHFHVVGCTLDGCLTPYEGPHTHCCVHGGDNKDPYYCRYNRWSGSYGYRCKNPDPSHRHNVYDADVYYMSGSRYFGGVWCVGTNMEAGLMLARNLATTGLAEGGAINGIDNVYVVLLSDGKPTWSTDETSTTEVDFIGKPRTINEWQSIKDIVVTGEEGDIAIAEDIKKVAELHAILYSADLEKKFDCGSGHPLTGKSGADWLKGNTSDYGVHADLVVDSPEADGIEEAFLSINDRIDVMAKAWTVSDELSDDVTFGEFTLNGDYAGVNDSSVSWSLGRMNPESGSGTVADPWVYTLKYTVNLNSAKDDVKAISLAHDADPSLNGVWTGENAVLQYLMVEKDVLETMTPDKIKKQLRDAAFADVSVKGIYGGLTFVKKDGEIDQPIAGAGFTLYDSENKAYGGEVFSDSEGNVVFANLPRGEYTLKETTVPAGMQEMTALGLKESWGVVTAADGSAAPAVINNWKREEVTPKPTRHYYIVTVNYVDENGAKIAESYVSSAARSGSSYDVTDKDAIAIEGYTYVNTTGDSLTGRLNSNKVIYVHYATEIVEIPDEDVPVGETPVEPPVVEIPEEEPPLADAPETGDAFAVWMAMSALSGAALFVTRKKREDEE